MRSTNRVDSFYLQVNELLRADSEKPVMVILISPLLITMMALGAYQVKAKLD